MLESVLRTTSRYETPGDTTLGVAGNGDWDGTDEEVEGGHVETAAVDLVFFVVELVVVVVVVVLLDAGFLCSLMSNF